MDSLFIIVKEGAEEAFKNLDFLEGANGGDSSMAVRSKYI
jgi:hypothetical protein